MQQPPRLDYQSAPAAPKRSRMRRSSARTVVAGWIVVGGAMWFAAAHSGDRDPLQWPAAMFSVLALFFAMAMTLHHWFVVVPAVRDRERRSTR